MKTPSATLALCALLFSGAACQADITSVPLGCDCDSCMTCNMGDLQTVGPHEFQLAITGTQSTCGAGLISGDILTDTETDPMLTLLYQIGNSSDVAWTQYQALVTMDKPFSLDNVTVNNAGWTCDVTQPLSDFAGTVGPEPSTSAAAIPSVSQTP